MVWYGALPAPPDGYDIGALETDGMRYWPGLIVMTEAERAEIAQARANAVKALIDPATLELPITGDEQRELLGYPVEEEPKVEEPEEPEEMTANARAVEAVIAQAMANYRAGTIDADILATFAIAEWAEAINE